MRLWPKIKIAFDIIYKKMILLFLGMDGLFGMHVDVFSRWRIFSGLTVVLALYEDGTNYYRKKDLQHTWERREETKTTKMKVKT